MGRKAKVKQQLEIRAKEIIRLFNSIANLNKSYNHKQKIHFNNYQRG